MIADLTQNWKRIAAGLLSQPSGQAEAWAEAFAFLQSLGGNAPEGVTAIRGRDIYARVLSYPTIEREAGKFESHIDYVDIQAPLIGAEAIEWNPIRALEVKSAYDQENDVVFYVTPERSFGRVFLMPGMFAVLFPDDAHMPQLRVPGEDSVKKVVIKIRHALVSP
ncbi:MAG: hypothetical protein BWZ10_02238 [candidate division BRC1 bacterium ADurb.BinA364]|nr:MAG: hypothetical protein BWZ10_02238 [candidate division BRC1 bacterium ADurb.BinA364]